MPPKKNKSVFSNKDFKKMVEADPDGQVYGLVERALGDRFFNVKCFDGKNRRCKIRNKRIKITPDSVVIISIRPFDKGDKTGDIIHKYEPEEVRILQKEGKIPSQDQIGLGNTSGNVEETDVFDFEDI